MQITDNKLKIEQFLNTYFNGIGTEELINIRKINKFGVNNSSAKIENVMELLTADNIKYKDTYFCLSTFKDNSSYKTDNIEYRYSIAFDWDLKDFLNCSKEDLQQMYREDRTLFDTNKRALLTDIYKRLSNNKGIYLHYLIDSGYGYHGYILIDKTNNVEKVIEVQKVLIKRLDSDIMCKDMVRVLRVPYSFNVKGNNNVLTKIVKDNVTNNPNFSRYNIDRLYNKLCKSSKYNIEKTEHKVEHKVEHKTFICIENALKNGSCKNEKNDDLLNIVVYLRKKGHSLEEIQNICKDWDNKSDYKDFTEYRVNYIYKNQKSYDFKCSSCKNKYECQKREIEKFEHNDGYGTITIEDKYSKLTKAAKVKKYKEVKGRNGKMSKVCISELSGSEILLINILKYNGTMTKSEFIKELTYTKKKKVKNVAMSEPTFIKTTKLLEQKGFINIVNGNSRKGEENSYSLNKVRAKEENTIEVGYMVNIFAIMGAITPNELKLYILLRYIHKEQQRESSNVWSGALLRINQSDVAKWFYGSDSATYKGHISNMIEGLIESKLLKIHSISTDDKGRDYYTYKLVK